MLVLGLTAAFRLPVAAQEPRVEVGSGATALVVAGDGVARVEAADGFAQPLELPGNAAPAKITDLADGWVLLGTQAQPYGRDLFLVVSVRSHVAELPPPPDWTGTRRAPTALVESGSLVGLAWIEGRSEELTSVRVADWDGEHWGAPVVVSPPTGTAQLAVDAAVLGDGSRLLVWSMVDGEDDEIVWSRSIGGPWSEPQRVHEDNSAPDFKPAVTEVDGGALAAWIWLDGRDFRIRTARFDGLGWSLGEPMGGRGSWAPEFQGDGQSVHLVFSAERPAAWEVVEFDRRGRLRRRGAVVRLLEGRPQITASGAGKLEMRFPAVEAWEGPVVLEVTWRAEP